MTEEHIEYMHQLREENPVGSAGAGSTAAATAGTKRKGSFSSSGNGLNPSIPPAAKRRKSNSKEKEVSFKLTKEEEMRIAELSPVRPESVQTTSTPPNEPSENTPPHVQAPAIPTPTPAPAPPKKTEKGDKGSTRKNEIILHTTDKILKKEELEQIKDRQNLGSQPANRVSVIIGSAEMPPKLQAFLVSDLERVCNSGKVGQCFVCLQ
jgi:hypothetical protein